MQSIAGIITRRCRTSGEIPPILIGASVSVVDDRAFVFGGRVRSSSSHAADRRRRMIMTNDMYILDLNTLEWTRASTDKSLKAAHTIKPKPRYFHSASVYKNKIVIFGGMCDNDDSMETLQDAFLFDTVTMQWDPIHYNNPASELPAPRYAHLSTVFNDKLVVLGGQATDNNYVEDVCMLDLETSTWVYSMPFSKKVGAYRSIVVSPPQGLDLDAELKDMIYRKSSGEAAQDVPTKEMTSTSTPTTTTTSTAPATSTSTPLMGAFSDGVPGQNHRASTVRQCGEPQQGSHEQNLIYLYTNYDFSNVKRELQLISSIAEVPLAANESPTFESALHSTGTTLLTKDASEYMSVAAENLSGSSMPPGLRFPTGHVLGQYVLLAGTHLANGIKSFVIYALDVCKLKWACVDTGKTIESGSWNRGILHEKSNRFMVFGDHERNLLEDYNHRHLNFTDVAIIDLEPFGIYRPPKATCSSLAQEMGLALLNEPAVADFHIFTREGFVIPVNTTILLQRWPYFAERSEMFLKSIAKNDHGGDNTNGNQTVIRGMELPYPHDVVMAFLQFMYSDNLWTGLQLQPEVLPQLLLLADMYNVPRLRELARHMLHQELDMKTAPLIFETAALSHETNLQIRALKMMIAAKKKFQESERQERQMRQAQAQAMQPRVTGSPRSEPMQISPSSSSSSSKHHHSHSISPSPSPLMQHRKHTQSPKSDLADRTSVDHQNYHGNPERSRTRTPSFTSPRSIFSSSSSRSTSAQSKPPQMTSKSPPPMPVPVVPVPSRSTGTKSKSKNIFRAFSSKKTSNSAQ